MEQTVQKIMEIINEATDIPMEDMSADSNMMEDLEMSSLEVMSMIAEVEKVFKVKVPSKAIRGFALISDIAEFIQNQ